MLRVRVGDLIFHGFADDGFVLDPEGFKGWDDGVDVRRDVTERPAAHGSFDLPGTLDARVVALSGFCFAESEEKLAWYRSKFTGLGAQGGKLRMAVDHHGSTLWADVRLASKPIFQVDGGQASARFEIQFWAADPRKFGETRTFGPSRVLSQWHYGNFPAAPLLTVTGSSPSGYTLAAIGGLAYTVTAPLVNGVPHTVDMSTGLLRVGGSLTYGAVSRADTWTVPPGARLSGSITGGSAVFTSTVTDTYI